MKKFHLEIACDNEAFEYDIDGLESETSLGEGLARILRELADKLQGTENEIIETHEAPLRDINGNRVGRIWMTHEPPKRKRKR